MSRRTEACKSWLRQGLVERIAAISSGLLVAFAFPHFDIWPLAWFAFVPLLLVIRGKSLGVVFRLALLAGTTANFVGFFWMVNMLHRFGHLPLVVSIPIIFVGSIWQGIAIGGAVGVAAYINKKLGWPLWLVLPFVYTGFEAFHPILFPWFLGNCQYQLLWLIQVCDLLGVSFLTFLLVLANGILAQLWTDLTARRYASSIAAMLAPPATLGVALTLTLGYGAVRIEDMRERVASAKKLKLGIIEPEIPIFEEQLDGFPKGTSPVDILKWNILSLQQWSKDLRNEDVDLLIWPESTYFPALSTYARTWESRWFGAGKTVQRIGARGDFLGRNELQVAALGGVSAGESRSFLAGAGGAIWKIGRETLVPEDSGSTEDLYAMAVACQGSVELGDTSSDQCFVFAAGNGGALLVRSPKGWVRLQTEEEADWRALASSGLTGFVVGSENQVAVGDVSRGIVATRKTPKDIWVKGIQTGERGVLVSQRGTRAILKSGQPLVVEPAPEGLRGTVQDAAADSLGTVLLASTEGLHGLRDGQLRTLAKGGAFARVACAAPGECLAATKDGKWFTVDTLVDRVRPIAQKSSPPEALVGLPLSRHYWWLPADTTAVYRSTNPLPSTREFPGGVVEDEGALVRDKNSVIRGFSVPLLFGATSGTLKDIEKPNSLENQRYNSAFLVDSDGEVLGRYDKQYLLAFGEHIPFGDIFPALYDLSPDSGRFAPGPKQAPLEFMGHRLGILICYEDIIPAHTDAVVAQGAEVLLNLTNDAWFGKTKEPYQHFVLAAFRAVEQRRALVRATTTGISGVISATGKIERMTDLFGPETFVTEVPLLQIDTIYRCGGRFFPNGCLAIAALVLLLAWRRRLE
jgi:apolipoprotein N-acyltransferase